MRVIRKDLSAIFAASIVTLLSFAGSASAGSFAANPASLGGIPDGFSSPGTCVYGANKDVTFDVSGVTLPITNVAVTLTLSPAHSAVGDLSVVLFSPDGVGNTTLFQKTGAFAPQERGLEANVAGPYTFSDGGAAAWWLAAAATDTLDPIPSGNYQISYPGGGPSPPAGDSLLMTPIWASYFAGGPNPNGTWTLRFRDHCAIGTGSVAAATLDVSPATPSPGPTTPPPGQTSTTPAGSTGQRATALKRCKSKKSKQARKKCKKRATKLPV